VEIPKRPERQRMEVGAGGREETTSDAANVVPAPWRISSSAAASFEVGRRSGKAWRAAWLIASYSSSRRRRNASASGRVSGWSLVALQFHGPREQAGEADWAVVELPLQDRRGLAANSASVLQSIILGTSGLEGEPVPQWAERRAATTSAGLAARPCRKWR
jgi:hypothetical protein